MHAPVPAHGHLRATDGADGDGTAPRAVDADWRGERGVGPEPLVDVEEVAVGGVACEINQMQDAFRIHHGLGLDAAVGCVH